MRLHSDVSSRGGTRSTATEMGQAGKRQASVLILLGPTGPTKRVPLRNNVGSSWQLSILNSWWLIPRAKEGGVGGCDETVWTKFKIRERAWALIFDSPLIGRQCWVLVGSGVICDDYVRLERRFAMSLPL